MLHPGLTHHLHHQFCYHHRESSCHGRPDAGTVSAGTGGTAITDVRANDIVNGLGAVSGNSSLSLVSTVAGITLNTSTGSISVAQGTTPGSYTLVYQLCTTQGSPTTCTTGYAIITITAAPPLALADFSLTRINSPVAGNVLTNDTDPQHLLLTSALLSSPASGSLVFNSDGSYSYSPPTSFTGTASFCYVALNSPRSAPAPA